MKAQCSESIVFPFEDEIGMVERIASKDRIRKCEV